MLAGSSSVPARECAAAGSPSSESDSVSEYSNDSAAAGGARRTAARRPPSTISTSGPTFKGSGSPDSTALSLATCPSTTSALHSGQTLLSLSQLSTPCRAKACLQGSKRITVTPSSKGSRVMGQTRSSGAVPTRGVWSTCALRNTKAGSMATTTAGVADPSCLARVAASSKDSLSTSTSKPNSICRLRIMRRRIRRPTRKPMQPSPNTTTVRPTTKYTSSGLFSRAVKDMRKPSGKPCSPAPPRVVSMLVDSARRLPAVAAPAPRRVTVIAPVVAAATSRPPDGTPSPSACVTSTYPCAHATLSSLALPSAPARLLPVMTSIGRPAVAELPSTSSRESPMARSTASMTAYSVGRVVVSYTTSPVDEDWPLPPPETDLMVDVRGRGSITHEQTWPEL
mmetsp:Transcript_4242/g.17939  ORF Transcript_4242/g.17939 Transcript_4242/m.17939 type:complete len:396 (-) Transcript_4242:2579-3766(-)